MRRFPYSISKRKKHTNRKILMDLSDKVDVIIDKISNKAPIDCSTDEKKDEAVRFKVII